ncbi:NADPH-dependent FMN reductase [uncultured Amnibacterium sp.]|uniref:NADPH-dependent FMN reductase n=1 Tax=uncultured Amnibacterium sp. TaxID=1631851 RepID=UPI0035CBB0FF
MTSILAIDGSPRGAGRTRLVLDAVLDGARSAGAATTVVELSEGIDAAVRAAHEHDAFVLGAPAYRAAPAAPMKEFLDRLPRGFWGEQTQPITARAVGLVMTGATTHHYLALDGLRSVLAGFFAAHVLSPGLYVAGDGFVDGAPTEQTSAEAQAQGRALVALARAIDGSAELQGIRPQA